MHKALIAISLTAWAAMAQDAPQTTPVKGSISGVVKDAGTGTPMPDIQVSGSPGELEVTTDEHGRYALRGLASGKYRIAVNGPGRGPSVVKIVTLIAGEQLASVDFQLRTSGEISGKILDENKEPLPAISVFLIAREYSLGALRYVFAGRARTDDRGEYRLLVESGRGYLVQAQKLEQKLEPISAVPSDPKLRRTVPVPVYYPDSPSIDGAQVIVLRAGEHRQGMDIRMPRASSYCVEGVLEAEGRPAALYFQIENQRPTSGRSGNGGFWIMAPHGMSGSDGKIRICDLHPGDYQITAAEFSTVDESVPFFGTSPVTISDRDVHDVKIGARARLSVPGEVVWYGAAPDQPVQSKVSLYVHPLTRAPWGHESLDATSSIPGQFFFPRLLLDDYELRVYGVPQNAYLKDITYGGISALHEPLRVGSALGNATLRVLIARDGGFVSAKVADKDGNPVPDSYVVIIPDSATSEPKLAAAMVSGQTDQNGIYSSNMLPPGKYYTLAKTTQTDFTPESIGKVWRARSHAQEVEIAANATMQVTLVPLTIE
jgi:hypothetical protein